MTAASRLLTGCTDDVLANGGIFSKNVTLTTIIAGSLLAAMSCANQSDKNLYSRIPRVKTDKPVTGPTRLNLEEIRLDFPDSTLGSGRSYSGITPSGNIYYFDSYTCDMYEFGTDGTFVGKSIGYGRGPQESLVKHCDCFAMSDEGEIALFGSSLDFEYFSKDRKVANRFWIYKDGRLTADTEVPKGLIVTGYSAPYYYSQVFDANGHF